MNAFLMVIPLLLIRFVLLGLLDKEAVKRAAYFAPLVGNEKVAYWFYQLSNILFFVYLFLLKITTNQNWLITGLVLYGVGVLLCLVSTLNFAKPVGTGINLNGLYKVSRNPMYVGYFVYFLGCVLLTRSLLLLVLLLVFQISAHWIIRSEERWCIEKFGEEYRSYMSKVRRYI
jgi:Putative protein-S-isoprenylcysteine methyltransferase